MEKSRVEIQSKVDRQATSLLDITFWSNVVVTAALVVINIVNIQREATGGEELIQIASPGLVIIVSAALGVWMITRAVSALVTKKRLKSVSIAVTESGVTGVSMPEPMTKKKPERFSIDFTDIREAGTVEIAITKKTNVPALKIGGAEEAYTIPAPERMKEILNIILERMPKD